MPMNNNFKRKKKLSIILASVLIILIVSTLSVRAIKRRVLQRNEASKRETLIIPVRTKKIIKTNLTNYVHSSATVQAWQESIISSDVSGKIKSVHAKVGDILSKGDLILKIDDETKPVILDLESVRITQPGKYEIDLVSLINRRPIVFKIQEGKYIIDIEDM